MLGHISIGVRDLKRAIAFYDAVLTPLGAVRLWTGADGIGYGLPGGGEKLNVFERADAAAPGPGFHLAFSAPDPLAVDHAHAAGLAAGGTDEGAPGLRAHYGPSYYAAFLRDPEGWKLELVHQ